MTGPKAEGEIRVLLVDDQELVRSGLRRILRRRDGFVVAGECGDGAEVAAALAATEVDVVVMDLRMKRMDGIEATRRLRQVSDHPPVLALTTFDDDELLAGALRAGAAGYVLKDSSAEDLIRAVRAVASGGAWLDASVTARVLTAYRRSADEDRTGPPPGLLTPREYDVLRALGRGLTNAEIAATLVISEVTVKTHVGRIFAKLGLRDRAAAIVYAFDHGVVAPVRGRDLLVHGGEPGAEPLRPVPATPPPPRPPVVAEPGARLHVSVLGPPVAWRDGTSLDLGPARQQALLAALLLRPGVTVSKRELLDGIWELDAPAGNVVPVYVYRLRQCLRVVDGGPALITRDRGGYRFAGEGVRVDAVRLEELAAEASAAERAGDLAAAVEARSRALELFRGEPLAGLPGPFAAGQRARLAERRMTLSLDKLDGQLRLGRYADTVGPLSALSEANPHSEPVAALLMRALYAGGRQADALAVYSRIRGELVTEIGVEPGQALRRVHGAVLRDDAVSLGLAPS